MQYSTDAERLMLTNPMKCPIYALREGSPETSVNSIISNKISAVRFVLKQFTNNLTRRSPHLVVSIHTDDKRGAVIKGIRQDSIYDTYSTIRRQGTPIFEDEVNIFGDCKLTVTATVEVVNRGMVDESSCQKLLCIAPIIATETTLWVSQSGLKKILTNSNFEAPNYQEIARHLSPETSFEVIMQRATEVLDPKAYFLQT